VATVFLGLIALACFFYGAMARFPSARKTLWILAIVCASVGVGGGWHIRNGGTVLVPIADWEPFSESLVQEIDAAGQPYFVDFTAAWCLTCQLNERTTLHDPAVLAKFREKGVRLLRADWTNRDDAITDALERRGRTGVPVNALKFPGRPERLLPALLTPTLLLSELENKEAS
jgi:thiol:disulfide interchange protein